ncbi:DUF6192 family protein [Streptomyces sp. NPDC052236]|uniref:DUF6192 family protein n=1 Tax=Streptomyces sp. NPDC052236 TaxID=3365686 RepID=UPI0037D6FA7F
MGTATWPWPQGQLPPSTARGTGPEPAAKGPRSSWFREATADWSETAVDTGQVDVVDALARLLQGE